MIAAEATGLASAGGLGDVIAALPPALAKAGEEVGVLLPLYRRVDRSGFGSIYERLPLQVGSHRYSARILEHFREGVRWFFVDIPALYDRPGIYDENSHDYPDNHLRFGALCEAALQVSRYIFAPRVLHCHDWQPRSSPFF